MLKFGIVAVLSVLAGLLHGVACFSIIQDVDTLARGGTLMFSRGIMPEFNIAIVSLFFTWMGMIGLHRVTGIYGLALWLPLGLSALVSVVTSLILVGVEFHALPSATWKVLGIALPFMATGGFFAVSMAKQRW